MAKKKTSRHAEQCPPAKLPEEELNKNALELAHLALRLASAQIIPPPPDANGESLRPGERAYFYHFIRAASDFLEVCKDEIESLQLLRHVRFKKIEREGTSQEKVQKAFNTNGSITMGTIIKIAGLHRTCLSASELASVGIHKKWGLLSVPERNEAIYLSLTSSDYLSPGKYKSTFYDLYNPQRYEEVFGDLKKRKLHAKSGFRTVDEIPWDEMIDALRQAKRARESKLKRAAGEKSRKPRTRTNGGQFVSEK